MTCPVPLLLEVLDLREAGSKNARKMTCSQESCSDTSGSQLSWDEVLYVLDILHYSQTHLRRSIG